MISKGKDALLEIRDLWMGLESSSGRTHVLEDVSLTVHPGESIGIVGESGSGKSVLARAIVGVQPHGVTSQAQGSIRFAGHEILEKPPRARPAAISGQISMIFQDPSATLHPLVRVGAQVLEGAHMLRNRPRRERREYLAQLLKSVGLEDSARIAHSYPGTLSGGQRQRVGIAAALASEPRLLVADEPTTALDVTMQRVVLDLLEKLRTERDMSIVHITHDLGALTDRADRVVVMYAGRIVESGPSRLMLTTPAHPYSRALLDITPRLSAPRPLPFPSIPGVLPSMSAPRQGCAFAPRCLHASEVCNGSRPPMTPVHPDSGHVVACWHPLRPELAAPAGKRDSEQPGE